MPTHLLAGSDRDAAVAAANERLLNTFLRECGLPLERLDAQPQDSEQPGLQEQGQPFRLRLQKTKTDLYGVLTYHSDFGHHRFSPHFRVQGPEDPTPAPLADNKRLAELLLQELACRDTDPAIRAQRLADLLEQVRNSVEKTELYLARARTVSPRFWELSGPERTVASESALICGHPFHPTPKSSEGFTRADLERYAPELGASFPLCFFAADPEIVEESWPGADEEPFPPGLAMAAQNRLSSDRRHYKLLPCHPWQAQHLLTWRDVQDLIQSGRLVYLGELTDVRACPTSSIRTVWLPDWGYYCKLPLHVRITNFVRVNPPEQLHRTEDVANFHLHLKREGRLQYADFSILAEAGYRTLSPAFLSEESRERLSESFAVIFRENPIPAGQTGQSGQTNPPASFAAPMVVASLLETWPGETRSPLRFFVEQAARDQGSTADAAFVKKWLGRYVEISLLPLLDLFFRCGFSSEAHVQNSMVALTSGWPAHFYVRDLEGVSVSRERASEQGWVPSVLAADSPALYADEEAWHRFRYYVLVNHFGHLLHVLAADNGLPEKDLWRTVAETVRQGVPSSIREECLERLFAAPTLPAKANLISRFQKRGEQPLYVEVPNLLNLSDEVNS